MDIIINLIYTITRIITPSLPIPLSYHQHPKQHPRTVFPQHPRTKSRCCCHHLDIKEYRVHRTLLAEVRHVAAAKPRVLCSVYPFQGSCP